MNAKKMSPVESTANQILEIIKRARASEDLHIRAQAAVREIVASMEGKKITKRILPALKAALIKVGLGTEESTFYYGRPYYFTGLEIAVWGKGAGEHERHDDRFSLRLTANEHDDTANALKFDEANRPYGAAGIERNAARDRVITNRARLEDLAEWIETYNQAHYEIESALEHGTDFNPDRSAIEKLLNGK
jgi:hypothetical protein